MSPTRLFSVHDVALPCTKGAVGDVDVLQEPGDYGQTAPQDAHAAHRGARVVRAEVAVAAWIGATQGDWGAVLAS